MNLRTKCNSCKGLITFKEAVQTRPDLEMKKGESFQVNCQNCGSNQTTHINDIEAVENSILLIISFAISVFITLVLWLIFGAIGTITIIIPLLIWQQHTKSINAFNIYKFPRRS